MPRWSERYMKGAGATSNDPHILAQRCVRCGVTSIRKCGYTGSTNPANPHSVVGCLALICRCMRWDCRSLPMRLAPTENWTSAHLSGVQFGTWQDTFGTLSGGCTLICRMLGCDRHSDFVSKRQ